MRKVFFFILILLNALSFNSQAQRKYQSLDRGVVAVNNGLSASSPVFISWRLLAQDPDSIRFNLYCNPGGTGNYNLLNTSGPLINTHFSTLLDKVPNNSLLCVAPVIGGVEGTRSLPYRFKHQTYRSIYLDITYSDFLSHTDYTTKFIWPADLDGDGEYDYVVDRLSRTGATHKVEAYLRTGEYLWTIDMGPNVMISQGHDDMVLAYDMNCDGKAEVVIKSSDGTRFWDKAGNTWGNYLMKATNGDTDNDGIIDYRPQSVKVPPQYITVVDGMTGAEMNTIEMPYPNDAYNQYTRTGKAQYMDTEYSNLSGHMGVAYLDGIHPSVVMEYKCRYKKTNDNKSEFHFYYVTAWGYKFVNGKATDWEQKYTWNRNFQNAAEFHHIRIGDVDSDGKDEMLEGGYTIDDDGKLLFSAKISHGDRFRVGDINPNRPGLETFAIQQNAPDMLGQILYDAGTGEAIKKWYLAGVGDVGRGECIDIDKAHKGYEMWSTMGNIFNAQGDIIYKGSVDMPKEGMWWDGELDREIMDAKDGNGANAMIVKYAGNGSYQNNRLIQFSQMMNWTVMSEYGARPAFFGDIAGDWREEILLKKRVTISEGVERCDGFFGFTTDYPTNVRLYCLSENPMYRMQTTTKGYYQSPYPDYYLGYDMPMPPLPPMMKTDLVWKSGSHWNTTAQNFTGYNESENLSFSNGKTVLFDISGNNSDTVRLEGLIEPSVLYAMTPVGHDYILGGGGTLSGNLELIKSQNGKFTLLGKHTYSGKTIISEGTLELNGSLTSKIHLKAKGTLAGNALISGGIEAEAGLNYEGGRFSPGTSSNPYGTITFDGDISLTGGNYLELNLQTIEPETKNPATRSDSIRINGNLELKGVSILNIKANEEKPLAGRYPLITWSGELKGDLTNFRIEGLKGMSTALEISDKTLFLIIKGQREAQMGVHWTGRVSGNWDFNTDNFEISGTPVSFVNGDQVLFDDLANQKTIVLKDFMETNGLTVDNSGGDYIFSGTTGGLSGSGGLTKNGTSALKLLTTKNTYTGPTIVNEGILEVNELALAGNPSSIGSASTSATNLVINKATFRINNANTATDRALTIQDTSTIDISQSNSFTTLKGIIVGEGTLVKTGPGQLSLTYDGPNTYSGGTMVKAGTLAMGTWRSTFGKPGTKLTISGSSAVTIFNNNSTSAVPVFNYAVEVPEGSNVKLNAGQRCQINGTLTGAGTLTLYVPYVRTDLTGNWSAFEGTLSVIPDNDGGDFRLCNSNGLEHASVYLADKVNMGHYLAGRGDALAATSKIGSLGGSAAANLYNGTYLVGYNNKNAAFSGIIHAGVTVAKYGTGTWTLTNANLNSSAFNIYSGMLNVTNTSGSATGSGPVFVKQSAALNGTGMIGGNVTVENGASLLGSILFSGTVTIKNGGNLIVGSTTLSTAKKITIKKTLTLEAEALTEMKIFPGASTTCDQLVVEQQFTPGGTLKITKVSTSTLSEGMSFQLFVLGTQATSTFSNLILPELADGLSWDTSSLYTEGKLVVQKGNGSQLWIHGEEVLFRASSSGHQINVTLVHFHGNGNLSVYDSKGAVLYSKTINCSLGPVNSIVIPNMVPGMYLVRFGSDNIFKTTKVIVSH